MVLDLTAQYHPEVKRFSIEHLAGILYRCVEHAHPRWDVDGRTAREFIDDGSINNGAILNGMTTKFILVSAYEEVRKTRQHMPALDLSAAIYDGCSSKELSDVRQRLMFLSDEELSGLVAGIPQAERRYLQETFLGRDVWEQFYQRLEGNRPFLNVMGYGKILFH